MLFVKVKRKFAEKIRHQLIHQGILATNYKVHSGHEFILFPVTRKAKLPGLNYVTLAAEPEKKKPRTVNEVLEARYGKTATKQLTKSFDIIGDIAIVEVPERLKQYDRAVAEAVMSVHPNIKVVAKKLGAMSGEFRVRPLEVIAGENRTETIHKENNCLMKVDVAKAYFSVRLSTERAHISNIVKDGENVLIMFGGVGPFAVVIGKKKPRANIVCIELNEVAVNYALENVRLNNLNNVEVIAGDVRSVIPSRFSGWADRIVMPLPKSTSEFLDVAFIAARNGTVVHFYHIGDPENAVQKIQNVAATHGMHMSIMDIRIVRPYAPRMHQICIDFRVFKD